MATWLFTLRIIRKEKKNAAPPLAFSCLIILCLFGNLARGMVLPTVGVVFPYLLNFIGNVPMDMPRGLSAR